MIKNLLKLWCIGVLSEQHLHLLCNFFRVSEGKIRAGLKVRPVNRHSLQTAERIHRTALYLLVRVESVFDKWAFYAFFFNCTLGCQPNRQTWKTFLYGSCWCIESEHMWRGLHCTLWTVRHFVTNGRTLEEYCLKCSRTIWAFDIFRSHYFESLIFSVAKPQENFLMTMDRNNLTPLDGESVSSGNETRCVDGSQRARKCIPVEFLPSLFLHALILSFFLK